MCHERVHKAIPSKVATCISAFFIAVSLPMADAVNAQSADSPDLEGVWFRQGCMPNGVTSPLVVEELPLRARTLGFREAFDEPLAPKYDCVPATIPSIVADPFAFQIEQLADRVIISYEKDDVVRTIWLRGHGHPEPAVGDFFQQGHSVGWYQDGQLVVETTKFTFDPVGLDDMSNLPSSSSKKVTERYWRDGELMLAEVTTEDPLFLMEAVTFTSEFGRSDQPLVLPWGCDPELSRQPLRFLPPKYMDPGFRRITVTPYGEQER